jgi:hypothetical protein
MIPLESVDYDSFFPLIGRTFSSGGEEGRVELVLGSVEKLGHRRGDAARDPFSLTFRGPQGLRVPQGTYRLECEDFGEIGLFITQLADGAKGSEFEAVFT